jgi:hypothetical protein
MWKIKHIFDGDYGCEDLAENAKAKVSVTIENETGDQRIESVEDEWLIKKGLDVGSIWLEDDWTKNCSSKTVNVHDFIKKMQDLEVKE